MSQWKPRTGASWQLAQHRALLLAGPAIAVFLAWAAVEGGYSQIYWYPGALVILALTVAAVVSGRPAPGSPMTTVRVALVCLTAFTAWSFCSIAWADVKGDAWDGANRTLLYLTIYALFALLPWTAGSAVTALSAYGVGVSAIAGWTLARAATSADPESFFVDGRLSSPTSYQNGNCAVFTFAFFILLYVASRRATPILLRGVAVAGSVVLTVLSLLAQSRGWVVAVLLAAVLFVLLVPGRARSSIALCLVGLAVAPVVQRTLDVYPAARAGAPGPELGATARAAAVAAAAAGLVAMAWALVERGYLPSPRVARAADRAIVRALGAGVVLAAVLVVVVGHPRAWASRGWHEFTSVSTTLPTASSYLTSGVTGNRYDVWRVAFHEFEREPVTGVGVDNFAVDYVRQRRSYEEPLYPHSLELRALAQTGIVGALLFAGFAGAVFAAAWPRRRERGPAAGVRAAVIVGAAYWLLHGSIDWFWEMPAATAPVVAALGIAAALPSDVHTAAETDARPHRRSAGRTLALALAAVFAGVVTATYAFPLLSALYVRDAARTWGADPKAAFASLDRARHLNPLSDQPDLVAGAIASRLHEPERMQRAFANAVRRNPHGWYGLLELGIADSLMGHRTAALARLGVARRLNPLEPVIPAVLRDVRAGRRIDAGEIDAIFLRRVSSSATPRDQPKG